MLLKSPQHPPVVVKLKKEAARVLPKRIREEFCLWLLLMLRGVVISCIIPFDCRMNCKMGKQIVMQNCSYELRVSVT